MDRILQVKMLRKGRQVVGIMVHIMAVGYLRGAAMATAVVRNHAIAMTQEEQHLVVPVVGRERPAMTEHNGLTRPPVLVKYLRAVFGRDNGHLGSSENYMH